MKSSSSEKPPEAKNPLITAAVFHGDKVQELWGQNQRTMRFRPGVNVLCGPNGCGKSLILKALMPTSSKSSDQQYFRLAAGKALKPEVEGTEGGTVRLFDFELDNPRTRSSEGDFSVYWMQNSARQRSHGELIKKLHEEMLEKLQHRVMLLDEPEQALDPQNLVTFVRGMKRSKTVQWIVATHSPILIFDPEVNLIEVVPDYAENLRTIYRRCLE